MSIQDIRNSYHNSIAPNSQICKIIDNLIIDIPTKRIPKYKTDFINLINTISTTNRHELLPVFKNIVKNNWNKSNNDIFFTIIKSQSLFSSIYAELMRELHIDDQEYIISMFKTNNFSTKEMVTLGIFFCKYILLSENIETDIDLYYSDFKTICPTMVISTLVDLCNNGNKNFVKQSFVDELGLMKYDMKTQMLMYDLEDAMIK